MDHLSPSLFSHRSENLGNGMSLNAITIEFLTPEHYVPDNLELSRLLIEHAQKLISDE